MDVISLDRKRVNAVSALRGFTLIELIMVMVIITVLSVSVMPRFFDNSTYLYRTFYNQSLSAAQYAKTMAVGSGCAVRFTIDSSGFNLKGDNNCLNLSSPSYTADVWYPGEGQWSYVSSALPSGMSVSPASAVIDFTADGRAFSGGSLLTTQSITLSTSEITRVISIDGETAYVR